MGNGRLGNRAGVREGSPQLDERERIAKRANDGRKVAKARGVKMGRSPALTPHQQARALERLAAGETQTEIALEMGVSKSTISRLRGKG